MVDTRHFDAAFYSAVIDSKTIGDVEEQTEACTPSRQQLPCPITIADGLYREKVKSIYIDPPYNTDASAIPYKNDYKDSSWLHVDR